MSAERLTLQNNSEVEQNPTQYVDSAKEVVDLVHEINMDNESIDTSIVEYTGRIMDAARNGEISGSNGLYSEEQMGSQLDDFADMLEKAQANGDPDLMRRAFNKLPRNGGLRDGFGMMASDSMIGDRIPQAIRDWRAWEADFKEESKLQTSYVDRNGTTVVTSEPVTIEYSPSSVIEQASPAGMDYTMQSIKTLETINELNLDDTEASNHLEDIIGRSLEGVRRGEITYNDGEKEVPYNEADLRIIYEYLADSIDLYVASGNAGKFYDALDYVPPRLKSGMQMITKSPRAYSLLPASIRNVYKKIDEQNQ